MHATEEGFIDSNYFATHGTSTINTVTGNINFAFPEYHLLTTLI